jgi:ribosomal protein S27E
MKVPTAEDVEVAKLLLFHCFDLLLWVIAMAAVILVALKHLPRTRARLRKDEPRRIRHPSEVLSRATKTIYISLPKYGQVNAMPCPECGHCKTRFRHRTRDKICDFCGNVWKEKQLMRK